MLIDRILSLLSLKKLDVSNFETEIEINDSTNNIVIEVPNKGKLSFNLKYELDRVKKTINDLLPPRSKTKSILNRT